MKVVVTFDVDEKNLDDLVVMAKVYRKKYGYKEFVSVENNLPLKPLPSKKVPVFDPNSASYDEEHEKRIMNEIDGWNACIDEITGEI